MKAEARRGGEIASSGRSVSLLAISGKNGRCDGCSIGASTVFQIHHHGNFRLVCGRVSGKERMCVRRATPSSRASLARSSNSIRFSTVGHTVLHGMFQTIKHGSRSANLIAALFQREIAIPREQFQRSDFNTPVAQRLQLNLAGVYGRRDPSRNFSGSKPGGRCEAYTSVYIAEFQWAELGGDGCEVRIAGVGDGVRGVKSGDGRLMRAIHAPARYI